MDNLKELLKLNMNRNMLKDIVCEFLENGRIKVVVDKNSYIGYINCINVLGNFYKLSMNDYGILTDFFADYEFIFSEIKSSNCANVFEYYVYN